MLFVVYFLFLLFCHSHNCKFQIREALILKNLENVQIDALDLLVLLYYYLYYCITNCITVLLLVNTCQYLFVLLHLNSFWKIVINVVPASIVYIVNIVNIVIIVTMRYLIFSKMRYLIFSKMRYERTNWTNWF